MLRSVVEVVEEWRRSYWVTEVATSEAEVRLPFSCIII